MHGGLRRTAHGAIVTITEDEHSKQQDAHRAFTLSVTFIAEHRNKFFDIYYYRE